MLKWFCQIPHYLFFICSGKPLSPTPHGLPTSCHHHLYGLSVSSLCLTPLFSRFSHSPWRSLAPSAHSLTQSLWGSLCFPPSKRSEAREEKKVPRKGNLNWTSEIITAKIKEQDLFPSSPQESLLGSWLEIPGLGPILTICATDGLCHTAWTQAPWVCNSGILLSSCEDPSKFLHL